MPKYPWIETILSDSESVRHRAFEEMSESMDLSQLLDSADELDRFWRSTDNLYHRVRAVFFLSAIHRFAVPRHLAATQNGTLEYVAYDHMLSRRFSEAIDILIASQKANGPSLATSSGLARAYYQLGFQTLADQVRRSVRTVRGNQWMFRIGHPDDHPLRIQRRLLQRTEELGTFPVLIEKTPVRMDFSHSGWSDIFFLGMDFPEGARVINASIDLAVYQRDPETRSPVEAYLRVIDQPILRLVSVDLQASTEIHEIDEIFDFARDYLGLLKAAIIASGLVPPAMEGCQLPISRLLKSLIGQDGLGLEIVSQVNDIPKGSRLAVSTNLLGCLISLLMRATGQVQSLVNGLEDPERRLVAARAILGEWLGGSGGGWQDSGGVWPGIKLIAGCAAEEGDPEFGVSRGRLLPNHTILDGLEISPETHQKLQDSLVLVHGGMAQNVGPILEMVTEKYLLRLKSAWKARRDAIALLDRIRAALKAGDLRELGKLTTENFRGPLQTIIPACTNHFTDSLIRQAEEQFGDKFWGFWMLGGMSGGGMGFIFAPEIKPKAKDWLLETMRKTKRELQTRLAFAMDPVVYDFAINSNGTWASFEPQNPLPMPKGYYALMAPRWIKQEIRDLPEQTRNEMLRLGRIVRTGGMNSNWLVDRLLPQLESTANNQSSLVDLLKQNGFDREQHEQIRADLLSGRIGLSQNRLPRQVAIEDVASEDVIDTRKGVAKSIVDLGAAAISRGEVGVITLAAGAGSRWTGGAGVVKALHPFWKLNGKHRSFVDVHVAKTSRVASEHDSVVPHVFTTGYLTHAPIESFLNSELQVDPDRVPIYLSRGLSVGLRLVPTVRDLRFLWQETAHQVLDQQQQKVRDSLHAALIGWASRAGEATDYTDNVPMQCMHPIGHWYEVPNLLRNGTLERLLTEQPQLRYLMLHNVDTLGASVDPGMLGLHIRSGSNLTFEVIPRRVDDRGGGLARVDGRNRLLEGLAMPSEEDEFRLTYYNSMTTWIDIDQLLATFGLSRSQLSNKATVEQAVRKMALRLPTYITIKDVKKRWGHAQEDVFPVLQFEKLWGDMTSLPDVACEYLVVDTYRGQQLKDLSQLDGWMRDGSADYVNRLCKWA